MQRWLAVPVLALLALSASAQVDHFGPIGGDNLISVSGAISRYSIDSFDVTSISGQFGFGHFLTDIHEVGATLATIYSSPEKGDDSVNESLSGYYNYNFRNNPRTWFYAGGHLGLNYFDAGGSDDTNLALGIHGGVRQWLSPRTAFFVEPRITFASDIDITEIVFGYTVAL